MNKELLNPSWECEGQPDYTDVMAYLKGKGFNVSHLFGTKWSPWIVVDEAGDVTRRYLLTDINIPSRYEAKRLEGMTPDSVPNDIGLEPKPLPQGLRLVYMGNDNRWDSVAEYVEEGIMFGLLNQDISTKTHVSAEMHVSEEELVELFYKEIGYRGFTVR